MNRFRKTLLSSLFLAVFSLALAGCGGEASVTPKAPIDPATVPKNLKAQPGGIMKENPPQ